MSYKPYSEDNPPQVGDIAVNNVGNVWVFVLLNGKHYSLLLHSIKDSRSVGGCFGHAWDSPAVYQHFKKKGNIREL